METVTDTLTAAKNYVATHELCLCRTCGGSGQCGTDVCPACSGRGWTIEAMSAERGKGVWVPRADLEKVAGWFRDYEVQHRAKGTQEGRNKADTNAERSRFVRAMTTENPETK